MDKFLYFSGHKQEKEDEIDESCFSQWYPSPFIANHVTYFTGEHWMMAEKARLFNDQETLDKILKAKTPNEAKSLGRQVKNFNQTIWNEKREDIVMAGNILKFEQHKKLKDFLMSSGNDFIVEASSWDSIWGIGIDKKTAKSGGSWQGTNLLGVCLMKVREKFQ